MANTVTNPGARLAGLIADLGHKLKAGSISEEEFALFLKRQNPFGEASSAQGDPVFWTATYFFTRTGMCVFDNFWSLITQAYPKPMMRRGIEGVESSDIVSGCTYEQVFFARQMGGRANVCKYSFTPDQIATLIDCQPKGEEGNLLSDGRQNIFYMVGVRGRLCEVVLQWSQGNCRWIVRAGEVSERLSVSAGTRVFRNTRTFASTEG